MLVCTTDVSSSMPRSTAVETVTPAALQRQINKHFGEGALRMASDPSLAISRIPSGILSLDFLIKGGWARGRHIELYGGYGIGKTLIALRTISMAQALGLNCAFCDAEKTYNGEFAQAQGVNNDNVAFPLRRRTGEEMIDIMEALVGSGQYDVLVLDSIASLLPKSEYEDSIAKSSMGTYQARLMSKALRKLTSANDRTVILYINQMRESVGSLFGPKMVTSGGKAMGYYSSTRIELSKIETIKDEREKIDPKTLKAGVKSVPVGHRVLLRIEKDKTGARAYDESTFVFNYEKGQIDAIEDLMYVGRRLGILQASSHGNSERYTLKGKTMTPLPRGAFKVWLSENPRVARRLEAKIREQIAT